MKKQEKDFRRHQWIYQHQAVDWYTFQEGELVNVYSSDEVFLGIAYCNPHSKIFARFLEFSGSCTPEGFFAMDSEFFIKRFQACVQRRRNSKIGVGVVPTREQPSLSLNGRLANAEGDFLPGLTIDVYDGDKFVVQTKTLGMDQHLKHIFRALTQIFKPAFIVERNDIAVRELEGLKMAKKIHSASLYGLWFC